MSWAGLSSNQTISFNNLQNGVDTGQFTAKTTIPVSDEQITKADANTYVNIDTAYAPYAAKANNQLVVKSNLVTTTSTTTTTTAATTTTTTTTTTAAVSTISWDFQELNTSNGSMQIYKNGSLVVNAANTSSGSFTYTAGDTISVDITSAAGKGLTAFVSLDVDDTTGSIYSQTNSGVPNASLSAVGLTPVGNTNINGVADDF